LSNTSCVSECVLVSPARFTFVTIDAQLELFLSSSKIINLFSNITHFTNRFVQYSRTVVRERPSILTALFLQHTSRTNNTCKTSRSCIDDIPTEKTLRYNYDSHYRLAQTKIQAKKSEMSVSISAQFRKIYFIFKINLLHPKKKNTIFTGNATLSCIITSMTSIKKNNMNHWCNFINGLSNNNNVWSDKLLFLEKTSGIIAYLSSRVFSSFVRPLSLHSCLHYFFN